MPTKMLEQRAMAMEEYARGLVTGGTLFDELGFFYVGPIDGHNIDHLLPVLKNVRDAKNGPFLVHVVTQKGKGYAPAEQSADKYHGVVKFDVATGAQVKSKPAAPAYTKVYAESLIKEARKDDKIVAITAAMPSGTGIDLFQKEFPNAHLRRRHRRTAWRDVLRRPRHRRLSSRSPPSIRRSCSAPTIRSCMTSPSSICRCASPWIAPAWSAPTDRPTPALSMLPISAACRISW